jgi:uncharacterized membrane protein
MERDVFVAQPKVQPPRRFMSSSPRLTTRIAGHPIFAMLVPVPIICFAGTLITDIAYTETVNMQWANMSTWMLTAGLIIALFAVITGVIDFLSDRRCLKLVAIGMPNPLILDMPVKLCLKLVAIIGACFPDSKRELGDDEVDE